MTTKSYFSIWSSKKFHSIDEAYAQVLDEIHEISSRSRIAKQLDKVLNNESRLDLFRKNVIIYYQNNDLMSYDWVKNIIIEIASYTKPLLEQYHTDLDKLLYDLGYGDHSITKEHEIELLEELCKSDSYFAEAFGKHFIQMKSNILNDFPILHQIDFQNT